MIGILQAIPIVGKLFDTIDSVSKAIAQVQVNKQNATTEQERIRWHAEEEQLNGRMQYLKAQAGQPWGRIALLVQVIASVPVIAVIWKIVIWDQMLGLGFTSPLGKDIWYLIYMVWSFWFLAILKART